MVSQNGSTSPGMQEEVHKSAKKPFNDYLSGIKTTVFSIMTELSLEHKSINLGQVSWIKGTSWQCCPGMLSQLCTLH